MIPRRALLLVIIALLVFPARAAAQTWVEHRPPGVGFALDMPSGWNAKVDDVKHEVGNLKAYIVTVGAGGLYYLSMYVRFPPDRVRGVSLKSMLDGARNGAVANVHGRLRSEEQVTVGKFTGRQIIIDGPNNIVGVQKFFMLDATLVQAVVVGLAGVDTDPNAKRFLQSLRIVPP
jgi:hypothetical protein